MTVSELKKVLSTLKDDQEIRILSGNGKEYDFTEEVKLTKHIDFLLVEEF